MTNDFMEFENYKNELELIDNLNPYEEEMYLVLGYVIRACISEEKLILRNVSADRQSVKLNTYNFMGESRFPDFVILSEAYNPFVGANRENPAESGIYGTVEIKLIGENLDKDNYIEHLREYTEYFKKVIYTNGLEWRFYGWDENGNAAAVTYEENRENGERNPEWAKRIILGKERAGKVVDEKTGKEKYIIDWEDVSAWEELLKYLKSLKWKQ